MARDARDIEVDRSVEEDADDFQWPDIAKLKPAQAGKLYDELDQASRAANKAAKLATARKARAKSIAVLVMEDFEEEAVRFRTEDGKRIQLSYKEFRTFNVVDEDAFRAWAEDQDERFYDEKLVTSRMLEVAGRMYLEEGTLPPGIEKYEETRLSRTQVT